MGEGDETDLLDLIYGAAVEPALWRPAIERVADALDAWGGVLVLQDQETGAGDAVFARADPRALEDYFGYFASRNPLLKTANPHRFMRRWTPRVLTDEEWIDKPQLTRSEYYNDFLRPRDIHSVLFIRLAAQGMQAANLNISRPAGRAQFGGEAIATAQRLQPHLIRAFRLGQQVGGAARLNEGMATFLDRSPYGLFLLDAEGRMKHANRTGETMLTAADVLGARQGRLHAVSATQSQRLRALIQAATAADPAARTGGSMTLSAPGAAQSLAVTVAPVRLETSLLFDGGPCVLVCAADLNAGVAMPEQRLGELFGLTPAEARVALALFEGRSTREAADHLALSFFTVRAHLARIFAKTGVASQAELARLMMRAVGLG